MDDHDPEGRLGTTVAGKYRLRALLGRGSMGFVYEAEDTDTGRLGALKILLPELAHNPEIAARLTREGKAMRLLSHPNIVALLDANALSDGTPYIFTELAGGVTLRSIMDAGPLDDRRTFAIVRQMLAALEHAHGHGIIHRDVKPENVVVLADELTGEDHVKFLDFGVAKLVDDTRKLLGEVKLTQVGFELFGSPHYVAPEVVVGGVVDMRADIYSTGAVLFELLAGVPPFDDEDPVALLQQQAASPVPTLAQRAPARTFAPELELLVADALAKDASRRFASASAMLAALDATWRSLQTGDPTATEISPPAPRPAPPAVHAPPPALAPIPRRVTALQWLRAHKRSALIGSAVMLALIIGLAARSSQHATSPAKPTVHASAVLARADADLARGATLDAVSAYERALTADPALATSTKVRDSLATIAGGKSAVPAVIALDLLARNVSPAAREVIAQASRHPGRDVRQRALAIAERDGFLDTVDRLDSYVLDLQQAKTCGERRDAIAKLRDLGDSRAITPLRRAKAQFPCIATDATDALTALEPTQ